MEPEPSYGEFLTQSYRYFQHRWYGPPQSNITKLNAAPETGVNQSDFIRLLQSQLTPADMALVVALTLALTFGRHLATKHIFMPLARRCGIPADEAEKIPESTWKLLFYLATWSSATYYLFVVKRGQYFRHPTSVWQNYSIDAPMDRIVYILYISELSFYLHSLYTTMMVDQRRRDTGPLMAHHLICIVLILVSYSNRSHKSGLVTLFLHDGCDVLLEATKLIRYFKVQHGHTYHWAEMFVNIGFVGFLITWLTNRLYWFPLKVIYPAAIYVERQRLPVPFITGTVVMLWMILAMNFYWFTFALRLLYKVATGQIHELEDSREFHHQVDDGISPKQQPEKLKEPTPPPPTAYDTDEDRKLSVDSGVLTNEEEEEEGEESKGNGYNLRKRRQKSRTAYDAEYLI